MIVSRLAAYGLVATLGLSGCSDKIDPRDGEVQEPIPVGVSVAPHRSAPQTGGIDLPGQDTTLPTGDVPGIMDTTRAGAAASRPPAAAVPAGVNSAAAGTDTAATPPPRYGRQIARDPCRKRLGIA